MFRRDYDDETEESDNKSTQSKDQFEKNEDKESNEKKPESVEDSTDDDPTSTDSSNTSDSSDNIDNFNSPTPKDMIDSSDHDSNDDFGSTSESESDESGSSSEDVSNVSDTVEDLITDIDDDIFPDPYEKVHDAFFETAEDPSGSNSTENSSSTIDSVTSDIGEVASGFSTESDTDTESEVASSEEDNDFSDGNEKALPSSITISSSGSSSSSDFNNSNTTLSDDSNGSSDDQMNEQELQTPDDLSHQEISEELTNEINTFDQQTSITSDNDTLLAENEAISYQKHLQDREDDNVYIFDSRDSSDSLDSQYSEEIKDSTILENNSDKINDSNIIAEKIVVQNDFVNSSHENKTDIINNSDVIAEDKTEEYFDKAAEPIALDFSDYYQYSDYSDYFQNQTSSDSHLTQDVVLEQQEEEEVLTIILEDVVIPSSLFDTEYEDKVLERFRGSFEDDIHDSILDPLETENELSTHPQSDSQQLETGSGEVEPQLVQDSQTFQNEQNNQNNQEIQYDQSNESLNETQANTTTVSNDESERKTEIVLEAQDNNIKNEESDNDRHLVSKVPLDQSLASSAADNVQDKQETSTESDFQCLSSIPPVKLDSSSGLRDVASLEEQPHSFQSYSELESRGINDSFNSSLFSAQQICQVELASEVFTLESNLGSAHSLSLQVSNEDDESEVTTSKSLDSLESINFSEDVLASIDSPRLFTQSDEQNLQDIEQLHFIVTDLDTEFPLNLSETYKLIDLTKSVELISEDRAIFEPPPYNFRKDLEQQEEWEEQSSLKNHLLHALRQAKQNPTIASYLFALDRLPVVTAKGDQDQDDTVQTSQIKNLAIDDENSDKSVTDHQDLQNQSSESQYSITSTDLQSLQIDQDSLGIFTHLSTLLSNDRIRAASPILDSGIQTPEQQMELAEEILKDNWGEVKELLGQFLTLAQIEFDSNVLRKITDTFDQELVVDQNPNWLEMTIYHLNDIFKQDSRTETIFKFGINSSKGRYLESLQTSDLASSSTEKFDGKALLINFHLWKNSKSTPDHLENLQVEKVIDNSNLTVNISKINDQRPENLENCLTLKDGLFSHIAQHIPILNTVGTKDFLDSLIKTLDQKQEVIHHLIYGDWGEFSMVIRNLARQRHVMLDPEVLYEIINILKEQLHIKILIDEDSKTSATFTSNLTHQTYGDAGKTVITYRSTSHASESLKQIITKTDNIDNLKQGFNDWHFSNYKLWSKVFYNRDLIKPIFDIIEQNPKRIFIDEARLEEIKQNNPNKDFNQEEQFFKSMDDLFPKSQRLYSEIGNAKICDVKITINNWTKGTIENISIKMPFKEDSFNEENEQLVEEIFKHPRIIEEILIRSGNYQEGNLLFIRNQVHLDGLAEIEKNTSLDPSIYGDPEIASYRRPDFVCVISRMEGGEILKGNVMIEVKKSRKGFNHNCEKGGGNGQSARDSLGVIHRIKDETGSLDDIEVTSIIATAEIIESVIEIEAEVHFQQVSASKVLPYAGRICHNNSHFEAIRKGILEED